MPENPHSTTPSRWASLPFSQSKQKPSDVLSLLCPKPHTPFLPCSFSFLPLITEDMSYVLLQVNPSVCSGSFLILPPQGFYPLIVSFFSYKSNLFICTGCFLLTCKHVQHLSSKTKPQKIPLQIPRSYPHDCERIEIQLDPVRSNHNVMRLSD